MPATEVENGAGRRRSLELLKMAQEGAGISRLRNFIPLISQLIEHFSTPFRRRIIARDQGAGSVSGERRSGVGGAGEPKPG